MAGPPLYSRTAAAAPPLPISNAAQSAPERPASRLPGAPERAASPDDPAYATIGNRPPGGRRGGGRNIVQIFTGIFRHDLQYIETERVIIHIYKLLKGNAAQRGLFWLAWTPKQKSSLIFKFSDSSSILYVI